jgi:hypothetical protein
VKIDYKEPTVIDRIDQAIAQALENEQAIDTIRLSATELEEFCQAEGKAFGKEYGYRYRGFRVAYDWGSYK